MKKVYLETYGCQMNVADSSLMLHILREAGYVETSEPEDADLILVNTCSVRKKAEERVVRRMESLASLKRRRPGVLLGITGCVPRHLGPALRERLPHVDLFLGPDSYRRLPELLARPGGADRVGAPLDPDAGCEPSGIDIRLNGSEDYLGLDQTSVDGVIALVPVMRGCDRFCTYCVVPLARGRERSLPPEEVEAQVRVAVAKGARDITLLGQTVNSYSHGGTEFVDLLERVSAIEGLRRVRFTSPHPAEFTEGQFRLMAARETLAPHLHIPVQSGSTRILHAMRRGYTRDEFLSVVDMARRFMPDIGLTTDLMTGFPGESDDDFEETLSLMREVRFDAAFLFRYSEREGTWAARRLPDSVPSHVKAERLERMISLQEEVSLGRYQAFVGREVEVLVEGPGRRGDGLCVGKAPDFKKVLIPAGPKPGDLVRARIASASSHTLFAKDASRASGPVH